MPQSFCYNYYTTKKIYFDNQIVTPFFFFGWCNQIITTMGGDLNLDSPYKEEQEIQ